jgi:hypothetical protein
MLCIEHPALFISATLRGRTFYAFDAIPALLRYLRAGRAASDASPDAYPVASVYQGEMVNVGLVASTLCIPRFRCPVPTWGELLVQLVCFTFASHLALLAQIPIAQW